MLSIVSDVSAILVAKMHFRAPGGVGSKIFALLVHKRNLILKIIYKKKN